MRGPMNKKVLLTGGLGFIGRRTIQPLLDAGYEVHVVTSRREVSIHANINLYRADLLECATHRDLIHAIKPAYLLHTAWYTQHGKFWNAVENTYWLSATISLARAFYEAGGRRLLALGTCAEYDWSEGVCEEGKTPENPATIYGQFKKYTLEALKLISQQYQGSLLWARIFFPYGPGESGERLIPYVIQSLLKNQKAECTHGEQIRDFMHVDDIAEALVYLLGSKLEGVMNVGSGQGISIRDIAFRIADRLQGRDHILLGAKPEPAHSPASIVAKVNRLQQEAGWKPHYSLDQRLQETIEWWQKTIKERV